MFTITQGKKEYQLWTVIQDAVMLYICTNKRNDKDYLQRHTTEIHTVGDKMLIWHMEKMSYVENSQIIKSSKCIKEKETDK